MTTRVIKLREDLFVPWMIEDFDTEHLVGIGDVSLREHCFSMAGLIPIQHIDNWEEVKDDLADIIDNGYISPDNRFISEYEVVWV
jgi:hypothetical protein